ncbi:MAG: hypothetical protein JWO78_1737 [Micavibrio sp.]|nr:hypothetical protein [Micavibrio sp.]
MDYHSLLTMVPFFIGLGTLVGFMAGLLGVGGGVLLVPGLFYGMTAMGFDQAELMHMAVGTSLAVILPTGMSSARAHWRRGGVRVDLLKKFTPGIVAGVVIGTFVAKHVSSEELKIIFASMLVVLAIIMNIDATRYSLGDGLPAQPWPGVAGGVIGFLATMMGIGGATITIPYMTLYRVPIAQAVGTASAMGIIIATFAVIGFLSIGVGQETTLPPFSLGYINMLAWVLIVPASVLMAPLGAHYAHSLPVKTLRRIFSVFLFCMAAWMIAGLFLD